MNLPLLSAPAWLLRLLGLPSRLSRQMTQGQLTFAVRWPLWAAAGLMLVALVWFALLYWRDGTRPTWWTKGPLLLLRLAALAALMLMLAQPTLRLSQTDRVPPHLLMLVDASDSMARPDVRLPTARADAEARATGRTRSEVRGMTRLQRANGVLNRAALLKRLGKKYTLHLYSFASNPHPALIPTDSRTRNKYRFALNPDAAGGRTTQIGTALRRPLEELSGQPVAGAIVLSDGGNNLGEDPLVVAQEARAGHIPISTMGLGDPTPTKDVALLSVLADDVVRANNTVSVYAALSQRGYAGRAITVSLLRNGQPFQSQSIRLAPDAQKQEIRFTYVPTQAGRFTYTVKAAVQPGEVTADNNLGRFTQDVIDKKLKILYIENEPRYEFRYLRNAILRDTSLDFACLLLGGDEASQGNIPIQSFPADEKKLFEYDIVVIGDVPRSYFTDTQLLALRRFVEDRGASLLVVAGEEHMPQEYVGTPLEPVLPVVFSGTPNPVLTDDEFTWQRTPEGKQSAALQLEDDPNENELVWRTLPGMFWCAGMDRARPGATVLAEHPTRRNSYGPFPLVAYQPFGAGKCWMQLVDSTWRWRWRVGDRHFYRFWGQVFRTLTPKELPGNSHVVQLNADRRKCYLGEKITLSARLLDAYYHPIKLPSVTAIVTAAGGQTQQITLEAAARSPGLYTAEFQPQRVGHYTLSLTSPVDPRAKVTTTLDVEDLALERQKPELDEGILKKIAAAGGGRYYAPDRLPDWIRSLRDNSVMVKSENEIELWDAPLVLILFIAPLALEWLIRKRKGLL